MTQPTKSSSKLADSNDNPQVGERGSSITAAVAPTSIPAIASGAVAVVSDAAADLTTTSAALAVLEDEVALVVIAVNALVSAMEAHGLIADN